MSYYFFMSTVLNKTYKKYSFLCPLYKITEKIDFIFYVGCVKQETLKIDIFIPFA
jgi:hypothetical protein